MDVIVHEDKKLFFHFFIIYKIIFFSFPSFIFKTVKLGEFIIQHQGNSLKRAECKPHMIFL